MVKGPGCGMNKENGEKQSMLSTKLRSPSRHSDASTMDSFQDGGQQHMNSEHNDFQGGMEGPFMNPDMNSYGQNPGEPPMGPDSYGRMTEGLHHGQMGQYNSYSRQGYTNMEGGNMGSSEYSSQHAGYGQYPQGGSRQGYPGMTRPAMGPVRPGMGSHGMGMLPSGYNPSQQRMMASQAMGQQSGPTPTLNQLLQTPNSQPRYPQNSYDGYTGPQKPGEMSSSNGPYGMPPQGWMQNQRGMGYNNQMSIQGSSPYRGQGGPAGYGQQGYSQSAPPNSQSQFNSQGSIQQQPQPPGQPPGQQQQQRPTPQPSPHQQHVSPAPSPGHRGTPNPSPGPQRPQPQPSPGTQQRSSQLSPSPSQRSSSSQLSPPGSSPGQQNSLPNSQHNHQSSPKDPCSDDVKGDGIPNSSSRPEPSPGSVGSRSNTPASVSGSSPMPPRPPSQQDGSQSTMRMNQSAMPAPGYSQQMMPPPMGPNQMGYSPGGGKMGPGGPYPSHYQNSQYPPSGNYGLRQPGPGMASYQQNMYNGPSQMGGPMGPSSAGQMGPGGPTGPGQMTGPSQMAGPNQMTGPNHMGPNGPSGHMGPNGPGGQISASGQMYNSMTAPGMNRNNYMYGGQGAMMGMNNHYGNYSGPVTSTNSQSGPGTGMSSPGPNANGPQGNMANSMGSGNTGSNGPMPVGSSQGQTPIKGAQAAAQAAMAAAQAAARSQQASSQGRSAGAAMNMGQASRYNPNTAGSHSMPPQAMPPQSMSPLSQMGQMNQMGYNATMNNMPHPQNSVSPVPNAMGHGPHGIPPGGGPSGKMHNSTNSFNEQPLPKSKSKSKSAKDKDNSSLPLSSNMPNSMPDKSLQGHMASPQRSMMSPLVPDSNVPNTQPLPSSTPTSSLSDASSHSNDSSSMGPLSHNDSNNTGPGPPTNSDNIVGSSSGPISDDSVSTSVTMPQKESTENGVPGQNEEHPITTTANNSAIESSTIVTQSIMSPVTSISTEAGNSNDSQPIPSEPVTSIQNCLPSHQVTDEPMEPPEKKRKTELSQLAFTRVAPSPGGASVASSGTHEDIDNIGSPGWPSTPKSGAGDQMKLYEMGMEPGRRPFLDRLFVYLEEKGTPITTMPVISKQPLDLYRLYLCVQEKGGMVEVTKMKKWKEICGLVNISGSASAAFTLKKNYIKFLFAHECRFDRGGMDPTPILNQMESDLEKKRAAKQRNRAPSPAGSQGSQDGMPGPNQYMQNDPNMAHMGQGMMGNHMMNNMGHGGPMMGPNNMPGPHHMGPGMQGPPGHMMGNMGPQSGMMSGNSNYMMPGGPNNMMGNNMGPQAGMMGPGGTMHGPNNMMGNIGPNGPQSMGPGGPQPMGPGGPQSMGPGGPQSMGPGGPQSMGPGGPQMHNSMNPMINNMNMPPSSNMMGPGTMMPAGMAGHQQSGMMPPNSMSQQPHMMRNMSQQGPGPGPGAPNMMPPGGMMRGNSDSVSCLDPFADEPYSRPNQAMPPYSNVPQSGSPLPPVSSGSMQSSVNSSMPPSSGAMTMSSASNSKPELPPHSASGMMTPPTQSQPSSDVPPSSGATTSQSSDMPASSLAQQQSSGASMVSSGAAPPLTSSPGNTTTTSSSYVQPSTFVQDSNSNSNSSMGGDFRTDVTPASSSQSVSAPTSSSQTDGQVNTSSSSQPGNTTSTSSSSGRQFPFGDQFSKPDRFDQSSPSNSMAQGSNQPHMTQAPGMNQPMASGMNQFPHPMDQPGYSGRHSNPMQHSGSSGPDHYNQGYHGNQPGYSGPPRPMMPNDQYQGYPNQQGQYGKPPMNRDMTGSIYNTPNKRYPDGRSESYMSPAFNPRGLLNYDDRQVPLPHPLPRPFLPDFNVESNFASYGPNNYGGSMNYGDAPSYISSPHQYPGYGGDAGSHSADRREGGQWSPMPQQRGYHGMPSYGPSQMSGMSPSGPPNMSHIPRMRMSPNRNREYNMSPSNKSKMMGSGMPGHFKKEMHFPIDTVESTQPLLSKRKRLTKHDIGPLGYRDVAPGNKRIRGMLGAGQIEAWRIMMALKSGLLAESTWALDTLNILLYDDSTVAYFGLAHLPGLLELLLDHFRRCLIDMFGLFDDTQIGCGHDDFKQNLIRMAILETAKEVAVDGCTIESKEIKRVNKTIGKLDDRMKEDSVEKDVKVEPETEEKMEVEEAEVKTKEAAADADTRVELNDSGREWKLRPNYTMISRQGKEVKLEENSDLNGLLDDKFWDVYCEFGDQSDLWEYGKGDLTEHIVTHLEELNEHSRSSRKFFRKPMKVKSPAELADVISESKKRQAESLDESKAIKTESVEEGESSSISDRDVKAGNARSPSRVSGSNNEKSDNGSENTKYNSDKCDVDDEHNCEPLLTEATIKTEPKDPDDSDTSNNKAPEEQRSLFHDEPRIKLAVKYERLDNTELVQTFKNMFGINTEGERNNVEDESYQRNEPPLCLTNEAQHEIGRRCVCLSNIFRSLSCIPGNDSEMSRHPGLIYILGKLLLLHHKHLPRSRVRRKFDRDDVDEDMVDTTQGAEEWWWDYLNVLRENTLVIFANICAQLRMDLFPDEICVPALEGLIHWVVCPSSCATDPLPTVGPTSVLSPLRLVLEAMCKLCIHDKNVDMILAMPPYERIVQLFSVLTKLLANKAEQVTVEFSIVLLSELVKGGSSASRGVALQHPCISLLIDFLETAEQKAVQVANMHTIQMLRDNPEMMGTSLDMLRRAATVLLHLSKVPENRRLFIYHQSRLLSLVMSQILDQTVASILSDVLFQCSQPT